MNTLKGFLAGVATTAITVMSAHAAPSAPYVTNVASANFYSPDGNVQPSYSNNDLSTTLTAEVTGSSTTLITDAATPSISVIATSTAQPYPLSTDTYAAADIYYYYSATGATGPVPIDVAYYLSLATTGQGLGSASISVYQSYTGLGVANYTDSLSNTEDKLAISASVSNIFQTTVSLGQQNQIVLGASGTTFGGVDYLDRPVSSSLNAFVDPRIYIDPTFLAANPGVSLQISEGIGNLGPTMTSPVPEPGIWALFLSGGCFMVGLRFRRRTQRGPAPIGYSSAWNIAR